MKEPFKIREVAGAFTKRIFLPFVSLASVSVSSEIIALCKPESATNVILTVWILFFSFVIVAKF